jgi:uncharacterized protein YebE (UPF0316 family)
MAESPIALLSDLREAAVVLGERGMQPEVLTIVAAIDWIEKNDVRGLSLADLAVRLRDLGYNVTLLVPPRSGGDRLVITAKEPA